MPVKSNSTCVSCYSPRASLECAGCHESVCKSCAQFADGSLFPFSSVIPDGLSEGAYCLQCFETKVRPEIEAYERTAEAAKNIEVFMKNQSKEFRLLKRAEKQVEVRDCEDRDEALLRLAFLAVQSGFDALVDVDLLPKKVRIDGYQTSVWNGTAYPARYDAKKVGR